MSWSVFESVNDVTKDSDVMRVVFLEGQVVGWWRLK